MNWNEVHGFFNENDAAEYNRLVNLIPDGSLIVEIGSFNGRSLASISDAIKRKWLKVWAIDLFETWEFGFLDSGKYKEADGWIDAKEMMKKFCKNMMNFGIEPLVFCSTSVKVTKETDCMPSLVFIDADHSYEGCLADIDAWWGKIPQGGIMAGHDFDITGVSWPGVFKAVSERFPGKFTHNGYIWSVQK